MKIRRLDFQSVIIFGLFLLIIYLCGRIRHEQRATFRIVRMEVGCLDAAGCVGGRWAFAQFRGEIVPSSASDFEDVDRGFRGKREFPSEEGRLVRTFEKLKKGCNTSSCIPEGTNVCKQWAVDSTLV